MREHFPLLSIVAPIYHTEKYLQKCMESLIHQSYPNIEIILVNDGSPGETEKIVGPYLEQYSNIKYVSHEKNCGLYRARITGMEHAAGDYFAFLDSDDSVSIDYYRKLMKQAIESNSDMVISDYLLEFEDGHYVFPQQNTQIVDLDLHDDDILNALMRQHGLDFSWHVVWNKVYKRTIWDECYPILKKQDKHLIMCEDVVFSTAFYSCSHHLTNVHGDYYFYLQATNSATKNTESAQKYEKAFGDIDLAFHCATTILRSFKAPETYENLMEEWKALLIRMWNNITVQSTLPAVIKRKLQKVLIKMNGGQEIGPYTRDDNYFYEHGIKLDKLHREEIKRAIASKNCKVVSFDLFDTLLLRPFWWPTDLFFVLENYADSILCSTDYIDFMSLRVEGEKMARLNLSGQKPAAQEVTLDAIYEQIRKTAQVDPEKLEKIKQKEIELELRYTKPRKFGRELLEFALFLEKKVVFTSDMYLSCEVVKAILNRAGYQEPVPLYLSSYLGLTKSSGSLYKYIEHDLGVTGKYCVHMGDNWDSDYQKPCQLGWTAFHIPKTTDMFSNHNGSLYTGAYFPSMFEQSNGIHANNWSFHGFLGIRCMLALAANNLYDDPFRIAQANSDFSGNPCTIGYGILGMAMYATATWLMEQVQKDSYADLHFMARDGYLPMRAYKMLNEVYQCPTKCHYTYLSRKAVLPLLMQKAEDYYSLPHQLNVLAQSPQKLIQSFATVISAEKLVDAEKIVVANGFHYSLNFRSRHEFEQFGGVFLQHFYNPELFHSYHKRLGMYLKSQFGGKTASFDIGYSARIESALAQNYGFDITAHYIHVNGDLAYYRGRKNKVDIKTMCDYIPVVTGVVREHIISEMSPSCLGYDCVGKQVAPIFEDYKIDYQTWFVTYEMQEAAIRFVKDMVDTFGEVIPFLTFRPMDACIPLEYFLHYAKPVDRDVFGASYFEDDLGEGKSRFNIAEFWGNQISSVWNQANISCGIQDEVYRDGVYIKAIRKLNRLRFIHWKVYPMVLFKSLLCVWHRPAYESVPACIPFFNDQYAHHRINVFRADI